MTEGTFYGRVTPDGDLELQQPAAYLAFARRKFAGKDVEVLIRQRRTKRSLKQNRSLFGLELAPLAAELGYERHELDHLRYGLLGKFFGTHTDRATGTIVPNKTSSQLTTKEFSDFMEFVARFAAQEYGVVLSLPNEDRA